MSRAAVVSRNVTLKTVALATARVDSAVDPLERPSTGGGAKVGYRSRYEIRDEDHVHVFVDLILTVTGDEQNGDGGDSEPPDTVLELEATYQLLYSLPKASTYPDDALKFFAELNGTYNVWPYWRELAMTVSGRVGIPSVVVQVFRPQTRELTAEEQETLDLDDEQVQRQADEEGGADEVDDDS